MSGNKAGGGHGQLPKAGSANRRPSEPRFGSGDDFKARIDLRREGYSRPKASRVLRGGKPFDRLLHLRTPFERESHASCHVAARERIGALWRSCLILNAKRNSRSQTPKSWNSSRPARFY